MQYLYNYHSGQSPPLAPLNTFLQLTLRYFGQKYNKKYNFRETQIGLVFYRFIKFLSVNIV